MFFIRTVTIPLFLLFISISASLAQETGTINGKVVDENNQPLAGVNIIIQNTNRGTSTKADGRFTFQDVSVGNKTLVFSYIGFKKLTESVSVEPGQTTELNIELRYSIHRSGQRTVCPQLGRWKYECCSD